MGIKIKIKIFRERKKTFMRAIQYTLKKRPGRRVTCLDPDELFEVEEWVSRASKKMRRVEKALRNRKYCEITERLCRCTSAVRNSIQGDSSVRRFALRFGSSYQHAKKLPDDHPWLVDFYTLMPLTDCQRRRLEKTKAHQKYLQYLVGRRITTQYEP